MRRALYRMASLAVASVALSASASGYYFFVHFGTRNSPYTPVYEKFDVAALKNKTVYYFISDSGPTQFAANDSFTALISELRLAAKTWNDVESSDIRIAFGGMTSPGTPQNTPGIDVIFDDDLVPGVAALGGPTVISNQAATASGGAFLPITRSTLRIRRDLHDPRDSSYTELGFLTLVHEFGHTLGLQHTLTSSTMSTSYTRATTKSRPLGPDDVAAISILYPAGSYLANSANISGRVTVDGAGANLASVVAISNNGPAVSTLTNPDGFYTIQGIPSGQYYIYVHPLPGPISGAESTPAGIVPPKDPSGVSLIATSQFDTVFYPGVKDPNLATSFFLGPGESRGNINFNPARRVSAAIPYVYLYGFFGSNFVYPAPIMIQSTEQTTLYAAGPGLTSGAAVAPGLGISMMGQSATITPGSLKYYQSQYIQFSLSPTLGANPGSRHLLFSANNDLYVLPAGILFVGAPPPSVLSASAALDDRGNRVAQIKGSGFDATTRILFDGAAAPIMRQNADGSLLVAPPAAPGGHRASVVALNGDGQSSLFQQPMPPVYNYEGADSPALLIGTTGLAAGMDSMVEILGVNTSFTDGVSKVGFGSSDITVRRVWVTGPGRILANISVSPIAATAATQVTVVSGLQVASQPFAFQILPQFSRQVSLQAPILNAATGTPGVSAGGTAIVSVINATNAAGLALTVGDQQAAIVSTLNGQIVFTVPAGLPPGPAIVRLQTGNADVVPPLVMNIDPPPPQIVAAFSAPGTQADANHPITRGLLTGFQIANLPDPSSISDISTVRVNVGGTDHGAVSLAPHPASGVLVQIVLSPSTAIGNQVPVTVSYNGAISQPFTVPVR